MASTYGPMQADPRFDGDLAAMAVEDHFPDIEQGLARLVQESYPPDPRGGEPECERSADPRMSRTYAAETFRVADLGPPIPRKPRARRKRRRGARVVVGVCVVGCAIWAWRAYSGSDSVPEQGAALPTVAMAAPPPERTASQAAPIEGPATAAANEPAVVDRPQVEPTDLAALRQTVEQLAAGQEQLTREIARLRAEKPKAIKPAADKPDTRMLRRVSAQSAHPRPAPPHPAPRVAAPARNPAPTSSPQVVQRVATASAVSTPPRWTPQVPSESLSASPPPVRPPLPVP